MDYDISIATMEFVCLLSTYFGQLQVDLYEINKKQIFRNIFWSVWHQHRNYGPLVVVFITKDQ